MKKLLEIQDQYIAALKREVSKPIELLAAAKFAAGNHIGDCKAEGCTRDNRCNYCKAWTKVWDDIDAYLEDNETEIGTDHDHDYFHDDCSLCQIEKRRRMSTQ